MRKFLMILLAALTALCLAGCAGENETGALSGSAESSSKSEQSSAIQSSAESSSKSEQSSAIQSGAESSSKSEQSSAIQSSAENSSKSEQSSAIQSSAESSSKTSDPKPSDPEPSKILVAYFSATNNTEGVAKKLADGLGADLYEITPQEPYTSADLDYGNSKSRSSAEMNDKNARPAISGSVELEKYDVVLIGYPIWWGEAPRIMSTFVESYDFSGKTLAAFCTSASSGFGNSDSALRSATGGAKWLDGRRFAASASESEILAWANGLGIN